MEKIKTGILVSGIVLGLSGANAIAEELGEITVESSTVNVLDINKSTEVSTVSYIDTQRVEEIGARQINELLQNVPGVTADVRPGEVVEIHMRGVGQQEFMWEDTGVAVIVDGVPVYAKSGKFRINMSDIKSIKVIKGSASYLYGNTATGGAIIITTSRPKWDKNQISLSAEAGSHNYQDYNFEYQHSSENYAVNINANDRSTDGYWLDSSYWSKSFGGKFTYFIDETSDITFGIDKTTKFEEANRAGVTGVTEARTNPRGTENSAFQKDNNVKLDKYFLKYNKEFANGGNLLVNLYDYKDAYDFISSPQDTDGDGIDDTYSNHSLEHKKQKGIKLEYKQELDDLAYLVGYEYGDRQYTDGSETLVDYSATSPYSGAVTNYYAGETSDSEDNQILHAFYTELKYQVSSQWITTFNIRHDIQKDEYADLSYDYDGTTWSYIDSSLEKTFHETSYRLGTIYNFSSRHNLFANIATGFRTPPPNKIFDNIDNGESGDIKTQRSITYEIGSRGKIFGDMDYELTLFQIDTKDIIGFLYGTYAFRSPLTTNIGDARNRGLELSLKSKLTEEVSFDLAYTYLDAEYTKHVPVSYEFNWRGTPLDNYDIVGNALPRVPNHKLDIYATYQATADLKIISELYAQSSYYADETNFIKMPGYAYLNLQARYSTKIGSHDLEFFVKVNNIFDKQYYKTAYFTSDRNDDGVIDAEDPTITVDPGREFYVGLKYKF